LVLFLVSESYIISLKMQPITMEKLLLSFVILFVNAYNLHTQSLNNCSQSINICASGQYSIDFVQQETLQATCIDYPLEFNNARWIKISGFTGSGIMEFDFIPSDPSHDIDFIVYKGNDCSSLNEIRCILSGPIIGENANCLGVTGIGTGSSYPNLSPGCYTGTFGNYIPVASGEVYYILVNNFNSNENCTFNLKINTGLAKALRDTLAPKSYNYCSNDIAPTLYYNLSNDSLSFNYQWEAKINGSTIYQILPNATNTRLSNIDSSIDSAFYRLKVTPKSGCAGQYLHPISVKRLSAPSAPIVGTITQPSCTTPTGSLALSGLPSGSWTILNGSGATLKTGSGSSTTISGLSAGSYIFRVRNSSGCESVNSTSVVINSSPIVSSNNLSYTGITTYCGSGDPSNIDGSMPTVTPISSFTYQWQSSTGGAYTNISGATEEDYNPSIVSSTTSYRRLVKIAGCGDSVSDEVTITINAMPQITSIAPNCSGGILNSVTVTASVAGGSTLEYNVNGGTYQPSAIFASLSQGNHTFRVRVVSSGCNTTSNQTIGCSCPTVSNNTLSYIGTTSYCGSGDPSNIDGSMPTVTPISSFTYQWQSSTGGAYTNISGATEEDYNPSIISITTSYRRLIKIAGCGDAVSDEVTISINTAPSANIIGTNTICASGSSIFTASGGGTYQWSANAGNSRNAAVTVTTAGTYMVTVTLNGCTSIATRILTVNPSPQITSIIPNCSGDVLNSVIVTASIAGGSTLEYNVNGGAYQPSNIFASLSQGNHTFGVRVVSSGCNTTSNQTIGCSCPTVSNNTLSYIGTTSYCGSGDPSNIDGSMPTVTPISSFTYQWQSSTGAAYTNISGATEEDYNPSIVSSTTSYRRLIKIAGCPDAVSDEVTISINTATTAAITGTNTICEGGSTTLTASGGGTYQWSSNAGSVTTTAVTVTPTATTTYTVTVTGTNGCTATATRTVTVNPKPTAAITGTNTICEGGSTTLTASGGGTYLWSSNNSRNNGITSSHYDLYSNGNSAAGCVSTANRTVTVNPLPVAAVAGTNTICAGQSTTLTASGGGTYLWSTGATTAAITVSPAATTTYTVTVTSAAGCVSTANRTVTVNPLPVAAVAGTNTICAGGINDINGIRRRYLFMEHRSNNSSNNGITSSHYDLYSNGNSAAGCVSTANRTVTVNPLPVAAVAGTNTICAGGIYNINGIRRRYLFMEHGSNNSRNNGITSSHYDLYSNGNKCCRMCIYS
jgi:hypothetical protein